MSTWYDYRTAWSKAPWLLALLLLGVVLVVLGVVGTIARNIVAVGFIPGLILLLGHHLLAMKRV